MFCEHRAANGSGIPQNIVLRAAMSSRAAPTAICRKMRRSNGNVPRHLHLQKHTMSAAHPWKSHPRFVQNWIEIVNSIVLLWKLNPIFFEDWRDIGGWGGWVLCDTANREVVFRVCVCVACVRACATRREISVYLGMSLFLLLLLLLLLSGRCVVVL